VEKLKLEQEHQDTLAKTQREEEEKKRKDEAAQRAYQKSLAIKNTSERQEELDRVAKEKKRRR